MILYALFVAKVSTRVVENQSEELKKPVSLPHLKQFKLMQGVQIHSTKGHII
jgi:hypothetical protein